MAGHLQMHRARPFSELALAAHPGPLPAGAGIRRRRRGPVQPQPRRNGGRRPVTDIMHVLFPAYLYPTT